MTQETIQIIELKASEGMLLTNGEVTSDVVFLGKADSPDNWWEIPIEEAESFNIGEDA